jgi:integrase
MSYRYNATLLKTDWQDEPVPEDEASLAALMKRFRETQKALMSEGKIEPGTVNERTKTMRHVVRWLHDQYLIPALPRQMVHLCAAYGVKTTAKALDLDTLHRLWNGASPRLKTYMSLALNCGFYVGDIASLEYSHIQGGYILKNRHKTGVPTRFKLWSVTKALLDANANGKDRLVPLPSAPRLAPSRGGRSHGEVVRGVLLATRRRRAAEPPRGDEAGYRGHVSARGTPPHSRREVQADDTQPGSTRWDSP